MRGEINFAVVKEPPNKTNLLHLHSSSPLSFSRPRFCLFILFAPRSNLHLSLILTSPSLPSYICIFARAPFPILLAPSLFGKRKTPRHVRSWVFGAEAIRFQSWRESNRERIRLPPDDKQSDKQTKETRGRGGCRVSLACWRRQYIR